MMIKKSQTSLLFTSIIYLCGFFLFLEWLYPISVYHETTNLIVFIIYASFCFLISMLRVRWWASFLLKGFSLVLIMNALFFAHPFLSKIWFKEWFLEIFFNIEILTNQQWFELTNTFRSFLFFLLIWLMSYLIYYWFITMKRIFVFIVLTFVYVALLDTFTIYDGSFAIIRIFTVSLIVLGMVNFSKKITKESLQIISLNKFLAWFIPIVTVSLFAALIGYGAPKYDPQWPDPVPFIQSFTQNSGRIDESVRKVGYGSDDSQLGGSFIPDDTPVFHVTAKHRHYWRIETKDLYTGKGWEYSTDPDYEPLGNGTVSYRTFSGNVEVEKLETLIEFQGKVFINKLSYPYGLRYVETNEQTELYIDYYTGSIEKYLNESFASDAYKMAYDHPLYDVNMLREARGTDPQNIVDQYTQVPSTLPDRVYDLAKEITASADNRYDQAKAIEQYFGKNGFQYQTTDIPYPAEEQDYVDQFLFDTKVGYCDNYSTSMVVMLRTLDIPARWVKGFTGGQKIEPPPGHSNGAYNYYEITNENAHSWVEVHFPNVGWVPFEPTQGFTNPIQFYDSFEELDIDEEVDQTMIMEDFELDDENISILEENENIETDAEDNVSTNSKWHIHWGFKFAGIVFIFMIIIVIYKARFHLKTLYLSKQFQKNIDFTTFDEAYHHLLRMLSHYGIGKRRGQTLREYAKYIDEHFDTNDMGWLTNDYERMLYNNKQDVSIKNEQVEVWHRLIKRINS